MRCVHRPVGQTAAAGVPAWAAGTAALSSPGREEPSRPGGKHSALRSTPSQSSAGQPDLTSQRRPAERYGQLIS